MLKSIGIFFESACVLNMVWKVARSLALHDNGFLYLFNTQQHCILYVLAPPPLGKTCITLKSEWTLSDGTGSGKSFFFVGNRARIVVVLNQSTTTTVVVVVVVEEVKSVVDCRRRRRGVDVPEQ